MKTKGLLGVALLVVVASCRDAVGPRQQIAELDAAQRHWRAQNLHTYAFTLQHTCFCGNVHPIYVVVLSDTVAGALDLQTGTAVDPRLGGTIDDLFAFVHNAIDQRAALIRVEYDGAKGFPTTIDYDGSAQIADDETFIRASDVHMISPPD